MLPLQLEGRPIVNVISDVLLVGEDLSHGTAIPISPEVSLDSLPIERLSDFRFALVMIDELFVHPRDGLHFLFGTRHEDDSIGLETLLLAQVELSFFLTSLVN